MVFSGSRWDVKAPVLKSERIVPIRTTLSHDSTNSRTASSMSFPSYMPMKAGCCSSSADLSISIVAKGSPDASTNACTASCKPVTIGQDSWQNAGGLGCAESLNNCRDRFFERRRVALWWIKWRCIADHRLIRDICRERHIEPLQSVALFRDAKDRVSSGEHGEVEIGCAVWIPLLAPRERSEFAADSTGGKLLGFCELGRRGCRREDFNVANPESCCNCCGRRRRRLGTANCGRTGLQDQPMMGASGWLPVSERKLPAERACAVLVRREHARIDHGRDVQLQVSGSFTLQR